MPPFVIVALGALGVAALAKLVAQETRRVNEALDRQKAAGDPSGPVTRLERDPATGTYRPEGQ